MSADYGSIGQRLKKVRAELGKSQDQMADEAGIARDSYKKYEGDKMTPGGDALRGLGIMGVDLLWLLTGTGGDLLGTMRAHGANLAQQIAAKYEATEAFALVPLYDIRAAAGHGALVEDRPPSEHWSFSRVWLDRELRVPISRLILVTVAGNSMEPVLHDGEVVMIDRGDTEVLREGIYVFFLDDRIYVKQLALSEGRLSITSVNSEQHPPQQVVLLQENETFRIIGRVLGQPMFKRF